MRRHRATSSSFILQSWSSSGQGGLNRDRAGNQQLPTEVHLRCNRCENAAPAAGCCYPMSADAAAAILKREPPTLDRWGWLLNVGVLHGIVVFPHILWQTQLCGEVGFGIWLRLVSYTFFLRCLKAKFQIPPLRSVMFAVNTTTRVASRPHVSWLFTLSL